MSGAGQKFCFPLLKEKRQFSGVRSLNDKKFSLTPQIKNVFIRYIHDKYHLNRNEKLSVVPIETLRRGNAIRQSSYFIDGDLNVS